MKAYTNKLEVTQYNLQHMQTGHMKEYTNKLEVITIQPAAHANRAHESVHQQDGGDHNTTSV